MTDSAHAPLEWRVPPWQSAILFLITAACAAANIYVHPSALVRVVTIAAGVATVVMGVLATRVYFVVDDDGVGVRRLLRERSLDWADIESVSVVERGFDVLTLRVTCHDGTYLDVPQSLVMPTKPTGKARVRAQLGDIARQIMSYGEPYRH